MATPSIPYDTSANTGSATQTALNVTTANTFTELAIAAIFVRQTVTNMAATIGGNAMTLVGSFTHPSDTTQVYVYTYAIPTSLTNPTVAFSWTGNGRAVGIVCEVNDVDDLGAGNGISDTGTASGADLTVEASDSPTASQRWLNFIGHPGNNSATLTADADHTNHETNITTNATGGNNVRGTLTSRVGTGAALSDVHTISGPASSNWILYRLRLSDAAAAGTGLPPQIVWIG
jgi:hypothetical protein